MKQAKFTRRHFNRVYDRFATYDRTPARLLPNVSTKTLQLHSLETVLPNFVHRCVQRDANSIGAAIRTQYCSRCSSAVAAICCNRTGRRRGCTNFAGRTGYTTVYRPSIAGFSAALGPGICRRLERQGANHADDFTGPSHDSSAHLFSAVSVHRLAHRRYPSNRRAGWAELPTHAGHKRQPKPLQDLRMD